MRRLAWLALPLCVLAGACGGGDEEDDVGSLSRTEFVEQANRICSKWNEGIVIVRDALPEKPTAKQYNGYVDVFLLGTRSALAEIGTIGYPSEEDEAELEAIFADQREILDRIEADREVLSRSDLFEEVYVRLSEYGLSACAR